MKLTEKQKNAVIKFLEEKIENLVDYQLINEELKRFVFEKMVNNSQNNAFVFLHQLDQIIDAEKVNWKLPKRHSLLDDALKPNAHANLFNLFSLIHYDPDLPGGEYVRPLKKEHQINFKDAEVREELRSIFRTIWSSDAPKISRLDVADESLDSDALPEEEKSPLPSHDCSTSTMSPIIPEFPLFRETVDEKNDALIARLLSEYSPPKARKLSPMSIASFFKTPFARIPSSTHSSLKDSLPITLENYSSSEDFIHDGDIFIQGHVSGTGSIISKNGSINIDGDASSSGEIRAYYSIIINGNKSGTGMLNAEYGLITIKKDLQGSGDILGSLSINILGNVSGTGTVQNKIGSITIRGSVSDSKNIMAALDVQIGGNKSGQGIIRSSHGKVTLRNLDGSGDIFANKSVTIEGNKLGTCSVISYTGNVIVKGRIYGSGKFYAPNGTIPQPHPETSRRVVYYTSSLLARPEIRHPGYTSSISLIDIGKSPRSFIQKFDTDGLGGMIEKKPYIDRASRIVIILADSSLFIDNSGVKTVSITGDKIEGLLVGATVIFNGRRLIPYRGKINLEEYKSEEYERSSSLKIF